jgi:chemotaxis protein histidine kinase CheA
LESKNSKLKKKIDKLKSKPVIIKTEKKYSKTNDIIDLTDDDHEPIQLIIEEDIHTNVYSDKNMCSECGCVVLLTEDITIVDGRPYCGACNPNPNYEDDECLYIDEPEYAGEQLRRLRYCNPKNADESEDNYYKRIVSMAFIEDGEEVPEQYKITPVNKEEEQEEEVVEEEVVEEEVVEEEVVEEEVVEEEVVEEEVVEEEVVEEEVVEEEEEEEQEEEEEEEEQEEEEQEEEEEEQEEEEEEQEEEEEEQEEEEEEQEEEEEEQEEEDVYEIEINGKAYYVQNEVDSIIYAADDDGDITIEAGCFKNGKAVFN